MNKNTWNFADNIEKKKVVRISSQMFSDLIFYLTA